MIAPARLAAYSVLRAVSAGRANLPGALAEARRNLPDDRDRALAGEIATGTLRWQGTFDRVITAYSGRPLSRLDPEVVDILRLTIFQLLHLDRVPASAAVNDAVDLVRRAGKRSAAPLVNAVLRRTSRERGHLPLPPRVTGDPEAEIEYLSGALSHPRWLAARWRARYGFEHAEAWCRFDNEPAALTLRANRLLITREDLAGRLAREGVIARATRFAPDGLEIERGNPLLTPLAGTGLFMVQDEASQLVGVAAAAPPGGRVLDACAAPGGKTITMAADMGDRGLLLAADVRSTRVRLLASLVGVSGSPLIRIVQANAAEPLPFRDDAFDCVLVDAPCSGLGTLRRDPDIKWRRTEEELPRLAALQARILRHAARVTARGGRLIYATCSSEPEENEDVVAGFLAESPGFAAASLALPQAPDLINSAGHLRTYPFRDRLEGFFAAAVVKARQVR